MLFCEQCRDKKKWTRSAGYPYIGFRIGVRCEQCGAIKDCHDVPAIRLIPEKEFTIEQKMLDKTMQDGYRQKSESLEVYHPSGRLWKSMTDEIQKSFAFRNGAVDWYDTYELRVALREQIQNAERRRKYGN